MEPNMAETELGQQTSVGKIQTLLRAKDDTSRFVGLALLKSVLDNTPELRGNEEAIVSLWESIPPKFLERLIRTGSQQTAPDSSKSSESPESPRRDAKSNDMLDLAVSVLHTFAALLPENARQSPKLLDRIPQLVACLLHCSDDTARLVLETLVSLVSQPEGGRVFTIVQDLSPLTEIASSQPLALDTLLYAWLSAATVVTDKGSLRSKIDSTISSLVASFKGTDGVTLLGFLASLLPRLDPEVLPTDPKWLPPIGKFIHGLVTSRPTADGRAAFTNLSAALLEAYPFHAPPLLFGEQEPATTTTTKPNPPPTTPTSYLLLHLLLIDLRATLPTLLADLNTPSYPSTSRRLTSAFNTTSHFLGHLLRASASPDSFASTLPWSIDQLLAVRKSLAETFSLTAEYLRDRWDAAVAGAMGLHPDARAAPAATSSAGAPRPTLAWDDMRTRDAGDDPLILAAVRALAIWVREEEDGGLRGEVAGLGDMFVELYQRGCGHRVGGGLDFRRAVLVALEGVCEEPRGREAFLENGGWEVLAGDLGAVVEGGGEEEAAGRGVEVVRVLLRVVEEEQPGPREQWMDVVTKVAGLDVAAEGSLPPVVVEFEVAALQLVTTLLANTHPGMRKRYVHSMSAVLGIAKQLEGRVKGDKALGEALEDVVGTLAALR